MNQQSKPGINKVAQWSGLAAILFFVFVFPYSQRMAVAGMVVYFVIVLAGKRREPVSLREVPVSLWALMIFYLLHCISMLYSDNHIYGFRDLETKMGLLLFSLASIFIPRTKGETAWFSKVFIASAGLAIIVCFVHSFTLFLESRDLKVFFYDSFSFLMHPTYFTMLLNIAFLLLLFSSRPQTLSLPFKIVHHKIYFLILAAVVLTSSRAGLVIFFITSSAYLIYLYGSDTRKVLKQLFIFTIALALLFGGVVLSNPESRFGILMNEALGRSRASVNIDESKVDVNPLSHRLQLWQTAWHLIKKYPLGTGNGDIQDVLVQEYDRTGFIKASEVRYNPHNQYLQTWLAIGIPGVISLLFVFFGNALKPRRAPIIYFFLAGVVALNGLFESVLEVQRGVLLFSFILLFFSVASQSSLSEEGKKSLRSGQEPGNL